MVGNDFVTTLRLAMLILSQVLPQSIYPRRYLMSLAWLSLSRIIFHCGSQLRSLFLIETIQLPLSILLLLHIASPMPKPLLLAIPHQV